MSGGRRPLAGTREALAILRDRGLLLLHDRHADSLTTRLAGAPVIGSWWGHERGREMFEVATALDNHPEVIAAKLIGGKVTFVHRDLWPALAAVGAARSPWQTAGLSDEATALLARIDGGEIVRDPGAAGRELEAALLCGSRQVHTDQGRHVLELVPWPVLIGSRSGGAVGGLPPRGEARAAIEEAAAKIGAAGRLPWLTPAPAPKAGTPASE